jgi:hypothetical protein
VRLDEGPAAATLPLLILACVLGVMLGVRTISAVRTRPQLQGYGERHLRGPWARAATTALAHLPALRAKGGSSADGVQGGLRPQASKLQLAVTTPLQAGEVECPESAVGTPPLQHPTDDDFFRSEATDLLKTKDRASGPNPLRTHFGNG